MVSDEDVIEFVEDPSVLPIRCQLHGHSWYDGEPCAYNGFLWSKPACTTCGATRPTAAVQRSQENARE